MAKDFVQELFRKLFGKTAEDSGPDVPVVAEKLVRSAAYAANYEAWKVSPRAAEVLERLEISYDRVRNMGVKAPYFHVYSSNQANGFFFDSNLGIEQPEFSFLIDHFKDATLNLGYSVYTSDRKYHEKSGSVQQIDRHYLKPALQREIEPPLSQGYGNILIEYVQYNDVPAYLKLMASFYSDRNYQEVKPFSEYVTEIFKQSTPD
jgi:hypothetical protein